MRVENYCNSVKKHASHICMLKHRGLTSKIEGVTNFPNVAYGNCGEVANSEGNVCKPVPLFI